MTKTQEQKVAAAVLQTPTKIKVSGTTYEVEPPTLATLITVSEIVSALPTPPDEGGADVITASLAYAASCKPLGLLAATLILGARVAKEKADVSPIARIKRWFGLKGTEERTRGEVLGEEILEHCTAKEVQAIVADTLKQMEIASFFALTTFLKGVNLLRPTKVESETTASGQSSEE